MQQPASLLAQRIKRKDQALCVSVDFMIDGTERPTHRPTDPIEQKDQYSGKKRTIRSKAKLLLHPNFTTSVA